MDQKKGLANVIAGILNKKVKEDKVILSKSKSAKEIALKKLKKDENAEILLTQDQDGAEFVSEGRSEVIDDAVIGKKSVSEREKQIKKRTWEEMGRSKPDVLQKETERNLQRIATKGVVQLFNAVKKQQKLMNERIEDAGPSERKKEKALQSISKGQFLDLLKGKPDHESASPEGEEIEEISEKKSSPAWNILRDDFMLGAKMKDWDKVSDNDSDNEQEMDDADESDGSC